MPPARIPAGDHHRDKSNNPGIGILEKCRMISSVLFSAPPLASVSSVNKTFMVYMASRNKIRCRSREWVRNPAIQPFSGMWGFRYEFIKTTFILNGALLRIMILSASMMVDNRCAMMMMVYRPFNCSIYCPVWPFPFQSRVPMASSMNRKSTSLYSSRAIERRCFVRR